MKSTPNSPKFAQHPIQLIELKFSQTVPMKSVRLQCLAIKRSDDPKSRLSQIYVPKHSNFNQTRRKILDSPTHTQQTRKIRRIYMNLIFGEKFSTPMRGGCRKPTHEGRNLNGLVMTMKVVGNINKIIMKLAILVG